MYEAFDKCGAFFRDTTLPPGFVDKYRVGMLLREPTFCDASYKFGGFIAPHRYLLISANVTCLDDFPPPTTWGLCVWQADTIFKVIDKVSAGGKTQITLMEIPTEFLEHFSDPELGALERVFIEQARETFEKALSTPPHRDLNNKRWRDRLVYPVGIDDAGNPFPLKPTAAPAPPPPPVQSTPPPPPIQTPPKPPIQW